ncbi:hypothetical protein PISMIDRAFT_10403 [Pisolithus microcarpus 441]|uniref:Myb/SANT-like domain-containing protein n=1 Tax=Pisolithus microcarpus 441 TaxID=765257 RepID=A0A0C9ZDX4_9AGAM|nr:hypothetical protein PISMIDRAFT_10403 [Pisolithus microcarpus 441]
MDNDPLEPFLSTIAALAIIVGQCCMDLVTEEMSSDHARAYWNDKERAALLAFLLEQKHSGRMGDGAFKSSVLNAAASHLEHRFPNQRGPVKNGNHCKRQIASLKCVLRDINQWCSTSGVHWDNVSGEKLETEEEKQVFKAWLQDRPGNAMRQFENSGWPHLEAMEELFPNDQACGTCAYHPTSHVGLTRRSVSGVSTRPPPPTVPDTFVPSHGYLGLNSSNTSSNPIITPAVSPVPSQLMPAWVRSPTGTIAGAPEFYFLSVVSGFNASSGFPCNVHQPSPPPSISSSIPLSKKRSRASAPAESVSPFFEQIPTVEAALHSLSVGDEGEWSSKRTKKGKEHSTQAALVGIQGSMSFLGSVISSSSPVAAQKLHTEKMQAALDMV